MSRPADGSAVARLGGFISSSDYARLPRQIREGAKLRLLDTASCVFAGSGGQTTDLALSLAGRLALSGPSSFWLSDLHGNAEDCAFVNSILIHGTLLDDGPMHLNCVVVPAALAVAEAEHRSGADTLAGIALGYETALRIDGGGLSHTSCARGFRHSWPAVFGAAAAAAYLMGLDSAEIKNALALTAAIGSPGTMEPMGTQGSSERFVQMAANAKNGVLAATLSRTGFTGIDTALEGDTGIYFAYTGDAELPDGVIEDLGRIWHWDAMTVKARPGSGVGILPVHCTERLIREHDISSTDIELVEVRVAPQAYRPMKGPTFRGPFTNLEQALMSIPFSVAAILVERAYDFDVVLRALGDTRVDSLAQRVNIVDVPDLSATEHSIEVLCRDGRRLTATSSDIDDRSFQANTWDVMEARLHALASGVSLSTRTAIVSVIADLDQQPDCHGLIELLRRTAVEGDQ